MSLSSCRHAYFSSLLLPYLTKQWSLHSFMWTVIALFRIDDIWTGGVAACSKCAFISQILIVSGEGPQRLSNSALSPFLTSSCFSEGLKPAALFVWLRVPGYWLSIQISTSPINKAQTLASGYSNESPTRRRQKPWRISKKCFPFSKAFKSKAFTCV